MERPEIEEKHGEARLVNWAKEQKFSFGETPSVQALQAIQWMKAQHECGERIDGLIDS